MTNNNKQKTIEVCRSFSRKLNLGNYETLDMFCSAKAEVSEKDKVKISEQLDKFVQDEVMKSVYSYKLESAKEIKVDESKYYKDKDKGLEHCVDTLKEQELKDKPF